jgi:hypothetical protein
MSMFTLTTIAVDLHVHNTSLIHFRYRIIIHLFSPRRDLHKTILIIGYLDVIAVMVTLP